MSLKGEERKKYIMERLNSKGQIKTKELSRKFNVSGETVRRYLQQLEDEKKLKRVYGGAVKITYDKVEEEYLKRTVVHLKEKKVIGKIAAELVEDDEHIIIDEGTTTYQMVEYLVNKKNLVIFTSSFPIASSLMDFKNKNIFDGEIIFIGGKINTKQRRTSGDIAVNMMKNFHVDKAFIASAGVLLDYGLSGFYYEKGVLSKKFLEIAKENVLMIDHSKIGVKNYYKFAELEDIDIVICDENAPEEWQEQLSARDIKWIVAE
ncbi:MAG: DeoR/GlpR family DNA-binding transcription regulator [Bacillota bacterium]